MRKRKSSTPPQSPATATRVVFHSWTVGHPPCSRGFFSYCMWTSLVASHPSSWDPANPPTSSPLHSSQPPSSSCLRAFARLCFPGSPHSSGPVTESHLSCEDSLADLVPSALASVSTGPDTNFSSSAPDHKAPDTYVGFLHSPLLSPVRWGHGRTEGLAQGCHRRVRADRMLLWE